MLLVKPERSSSVHTRRPWRATTRPSMVIESIRNAPCLGMRHCSRPVSMSMAPPLSATFTAEAGAAAVPRASLNAPEALGPATVAKPINFIEPSGQYASGQFCKGRALPSAVVRVKVWSLRTVPRGQGTPQLTPLSIAGGLPPSQPAVTASLGTVCAAASCSNAAAVTLLARIPSALRRVIFMMFTSRSAAPGPTTPKAAAPNSACPGPGSGRRTWR